MGKNTPMWGITFLAVQTYGAIIVPILQDFHQDDIQHIINHSDSVLLFLTDNVWENLDESAMPHLDGALRMEDYSLRFSRKEELTEARKKLNELFGKKFPERLQCAEERTAAQVGRRHAPVAFHSPRRVGHHCIEHGRAGKVSP